jgi:arylsulfatase
VSDGDRPNILVIWGDDIGITNLSCYSDGLMGYRTPNIDRIADEGMRFTDSYGEQSCTAGRSSFITGQSVFRTGLSKVGVPAAPIGLQARGSNDRRAAQAAGLCDRAVRQEPSRGPQRVPADRARL